MPSISIESGHIYGIDFPYWHTPWIPNEICESDIKLPDTIFELQLSVKIKNFLLSLWEENIVQYWFHDDIIPRKAQERSDDSARWQHFLNRPREQIIAILKGQEVIIQNEFDLIPKGQELIQKIVGTRLKIWAEKIKIRWYQWNNSLPSCEVLDCTFYIKKLENADITITVIPSYMKPQQERVRKLLEHFWKEKEIIVVYHSGQKIIEVEYWGNTDFGKQIKEKVVKFTTSFSV